MPFVIRERAGRPATGDLSGGEFSSIFVTQAVPGPGNQRQR